MKKLVSIITIAFCVVFLVSCKKGNDTSSEIKKIEATHNFYCEEISSMIRIIGNPVLKNDDDEFYTPKYGITAYMRIKKGTSRQLDYYQFDWTYDDNSYETYYHYSKNEVQTSIIRTFAQQFLPPVYINKKSIDKIDGLIKYSYILDGKLHNKEYLFSEELLKLSIDEIDLYNESNKNDSLEVNLNFTNNQEEDYYRFKLYFNSLDKEEKYHIDIQSWILTEDDQIIPFIGIYNYTENNPDYESISDVKLFKYVKVKNLLIKCVKTKNNNEKVEILYKQPFIII